MKESVVRNKRTYHVLTPDFIKSFDYLGLGVKRDEFFEWARNKRETNTSLDERWWGEAWRGEPVPTQYVEALGEYLMFRFPYEPRKRFYLSTFALPAKPPTPNENVRSRDRSLFQVGILRVWDLFGSPFDLPDEAYCKGTSDIEAAATMAATSAGFHYDSSLNDADALKLGVEKMKLPLQEYITLLHLFWKSQPHCVMFAVVKAKQQTWKRVGVSAVVPLNDSARDRLRSGLIADTDITTSDISIPSQCIHINMLAEMPFRGGRRQRMQAEWAQFRTLCYQVAYFLPPLDRLGVMPHFLTFAGTPENAEKLESFDYVPVGTKMKRTGFDIYEYGQPDATLPPQQGKFSTAKFHALKGMLSMTQEWMMYNKNVHENQN